MFVQLSGKALFHYLDDLMNIKITNNKNINENIGRILSSTKSLKKTKIDINLKQSKRLD